mmetsp:Transcript_58253/g.109756  ORF Transcript_58253/g.109756 Transcript_58253/m.109756 type:complete len:210 (-) Transcript_58253:747-1376(-)
MPCSFLWLLYDVLGPLGRGSRQTWFCSRSNYRPWQSNHCQHGLPRDQPPIPWSHCRDHRGVADAHCCQGLLPAWHVLVLYDPLDALFPRLPGSTTYHADHFDDNISLCGFNSLWINLSSCLCEFCVGWLRTFWARNTRMVQGEQGLTDHSCCPFWQAGLRDHAQHCTVHRVDMALLFHCHHSVHFAEHAAGNYHGSLHRCVEADGQQGP